MKKTATVKKRAKKRSTKLSKKHTEAYYPGKDRVEPIKEYPRGPLCGMRLSPPEDMDQSSGK